MEKEEAPKSSLDALVSLCLLNCLGSARGLWDNVCDCLCRSVFCLQIVGL